MAVGGESDEGGDSSAVYVFLDSEWVRLTNANLPVILSSCGAAQLSADEIIVVGGWSAPSVDLYEQQVKYVYIGTLLA